MVFGKHFFFIIWQMKPVLLNRNICFFSEIMSTELRFSETAHVIFQEIPLVS